MKQLSVYQFLGPAPAEMGLVFNFHAKNTIKY